MISAAEKYQKSEERDTYKKIAEQNKSRPIEHIDKNELINEIVSRVQQYRNYSRNTIINMLICITQNLLTVFSGEPGTGKTSICDILAKCLGLNSLGDYTEKSNNADDTADSSNNTDDTADSSNNTDDTDNDKIRISMNRYVSVSVEKGWSSKRDLIGYYNPLTRQYDRSNSKIYDALMILDSEGKGSDLPYLILLDEANLSPIEYYWADFMKAADRDPDNSNTYINIGLERDIFIPETLHFLATINNDQTTEQLSPRLIDRAWIIKLPKSVYKRHDPVKCDWGIISWEDIYSAFGKPDNLTVKQRKVLDEIYKAFEDETTNISISYRVRSSIESYICVAQEIMEEEEGGKKKDQIALDYAILQKLLPKIDGPLSSYKDLFEKLENLCASDYGNLTMTAKAIKKMKDNAKNNMGYCQYLT